MPKKVALPRLALGLALSVALMVVMSTKLYAIHPTITASAACDLEPGTFLITYTASANIELGNPTVNILFDGVQVDTGAFVDPTYSFANTLPAPAGASGGDTVGVSFQVRGTWSNGLPWWEAVAEGSTEVALPTDCDPPVVGAGCTPGYWKQIQHFDSWVDPYDPEDLFNDLPGFADAFPGLTLLQVLKLGGGGLNALGRHTVAALLNSAAGFGVDLTDLQTEFNEAIASGEYEQLKDTLDFLNNRGCPLD
jgi:hypothetical protein